MSKMSLELHSSVKTLHAQCETENNIKKEGSNIRSEQ